MPKPSENQIPKSELKQGERSRKDFAGEIVKANDKDRTIIGIASHEAPDRSGDVIKQDGWDLKNIKKNGVMLWGHKYGDLPVAKILRTWVEGKKLMFEAKFAGLEQAHPFAESVYRLMKDGFLNAFSVGFIPVELTPNQKTGGYTISKSELLEISVVSVPCHPLAIVQTVKSLSEHTELPEDEIKKYLIEGMVEDESKIIKSLETKDGDDDDDKNTGDDLDDDDEGEDDAGKIKFLSGLLSKKHEELKLLRKYFAIFSKAAGVERTENEIETIDKIGLAMIGLLKGIESVESKTKTVVKPKATPAATTKARPAEIGENDLLDHMASE